MSRVTPPVTKLTQAIRRISTSARVSSPSTLLVSSRSSKYLPRNTKALKEECKKRQLNSVGNKTELADRLAAHDLLSTHRDYHSMSSAHRPTTSSSPPIYHTIPLMQGFQTSAPKQAIHDMSTIDFFFFPEIPADPPLNPFAKLRVPLLPDNYNPDRSPNSAHAIETMDEALPRSEISIIASHPEDVMPATISEVVGMDMDVSSFSSTAIKDSKSKSVVGELWSGFVDDVLGPKGRKTAL